jgi:competence protein ComGC
MATRRAITLTEMLVTVGSLACLLAALVPAVTSTKDTAERTACAANLSQIGKALLVYAADHEGNLPDCGAASSLGGDVPDDGRHVASRFDAPGTCNWPRVRAVGNQANLWLLVREGYADAGLFVCPATADRPSLNGARASAVMAFVATDPATGKPVPDETRFFRRVAAGRCSYSYQNQLAHSETDPLVARPGAPTTHRAVHPSGLAVCADRNPYTRQPMTRQPTVSPEAEPEANSLNHHGAGQNVLYLSGEVRWADTPRCGALRCDGTRDHIYRPDEGDPTDPRNLPRSPADSFLVP